MRTERLFVGRNAELTELHHGLDAASRGEGRTFLITGEPGIGKTRLAWEFTLEARERGVTVYWGRCWDGGGAPPYWPWIEIIRQVLNAPDAAEGIVELGRRAPYLAQLVPELAARLDSATAPAPPPTDPDSARFLLFEAVASFLRLMHACRPLVVVIDDFHAADKVSALLLAFLARTFADAGISFIATYREVASNLKRDLNEPLAELARHSRRISLRGLTAADVGHVIENAAGWRPSDSLVTRLHGVTDGNPFFLDELLRLLSADGYLSGDGEREIHLAIPDGVREAIRRRLEPLSAESSSVLELAAVIGREFDVNVLRSAVGAQFRSVLESLADPIRHGLVSELPGASGRFQFRHALIREVIYDGLPPAMRLELHRHIGDALERLSDADPDRYVAELAHHFLAAAPCSDDDRFVKHAVRAAQGALARMAFEESALLYERTIDALAFGQPDERRRCELLLALGGAKEWANDSVGSRVAFEQAAGIARRLGASELLVKAALGVGAIPALKFTANSRCDSAPELLREALGVIAMTDAASRARLLGRLALHSLSVAARTEASKLSWDAVAIARYSNDLETIGHVLTARHAVLFGPDHIEERAAIADEVLEIARKLDSRDFAMRGHALRFTVLFELGDVSGADEALDAHGYLAEEAADPFERWANLVWRAARFLLEGRFDEAEEYSRRAFQLVQNIPGPHTAELYGPATFAGQTILMRDVRDDIDLDQGVVEHYRSRYREVSTWRVAHLAELTRFGLVEDTERELGILGSKNFADFERNGTWVASMSYLSDAIELVGDRCRAATVYSMLLPFAERNVTISHIASRGSVSHALGLLAATMGNWEGAERHFQAAIAMNRRMRARPHVALACYDYARLLVRHGGPGAQSSASHIVREALSHATDLRMDGLVRRCEGLLAHLLDCTNQPEIRSISSAIGLRQSGQLWILSHAKEQFHLKHAKGLVYVAELLRQPNHEIHALDLLALTLATEDLDLGSSSSGATHAVPLPSTSFADEVLDAPARRAYQRRLDELTRELANAEITGDPERTLTLREEITALRRELARAIGLGGRRRRTSDAERARISVTRTIRLALARIAEASPAVGGRLAREIRTGTFCVYKPEAQSPWSARSRGEATPAESAPTHAPRP